MKKTPFQTFSKKTFSFFYSHVSLVVIGLSCLLVLGVISLRFVSVKKTTPLYVRLKLSQGAWWNRAGKPGAWYVKALLEEKDNERDITGETKTQIVSVDYFPWPNADGYYSADEYDVYVTARINSLYNPKTAAYVFKDSALLVGSPITLEFPHVLVTGTVLDMSDKPFKDEFSYKTVLISKSYSYPWELSAIQIGDNFKNGKSTVVEVMDKWHEGFVSIIPVEHQLTDQSYSRERMTVFVKLRMRLKKVGGEWLLNDEQVIRAGKTFNFALPSFSFGDYVVVEIE